MTAKFYARLFIACGIVLLSATACWRGADQSAVPVPEKEGSGQIVSDENPKTAEDVGGPSHAKKGGIRESTAPDPCSPERVKTDFSSPEDLQRAQADCDKQSQTVALEGGFPYQRIGWEQGLTWWPHRPAYRFVHRAAGLGTEVVFRNADKDGKAPNPSSQSAVFGVVYDKVSPPGTHSVAAILDEGGFLSKTSYYPPGSSLSMGSVFKKKTLVVRGRVAYVWEMYRHPQEGQTRGNLDRRTIFWEGATPNGGLLLQEFLVSPVVYTEQQTVDLINALQEVQ